MESANELLRAHAATLMVQRGEEALPELARLASKGTVAVRREAIAAVGKIGGDAALRTLVDLLGDAHCWRALLHAILPYGQAAVPPLADVLAAERKRVPEARRLMAAALLYRLDAYPALEGLLKAKNEDPMLQGFAVASRARAGGRWQEPPAVLEGVQWDRFFLTLGPVAVARAEAAGDLDPLVVLFDRGAVNEVRTVARWAACGGPMEGPLAEHFLGQLTADRSKDRDRAASALRGLAHPDIVPSLVSLVEAREVAVGTAAEILAEIGGSHAVGALLDLAREDRSIAEEAIRGLKQLGDPSAAPALLKLLATRPDLTSVEAALIALEDGAVDLLAREMRAREGTPLAGRIQQILLQMKSRRAKKALQGTEPDSVEALLSRLGHPKLGAGAAKELAGRGEAMLDTLERVLADNNLRARLNALSAVGSIKGTRAREIVYQVVEQSLHNASVTAEAMVCARAMEQLAGPAEPRATSLLTKGLASGVYNVQETAARILAKAGPEAVPLVMPLLGASDPSIRARAIEVLGKLQAAEAEQKGIELLSDSALFVRQAAAGALGSIGAATGNPRVVDALGAALQKEMDFAAIPFIDALVRIGRREAIPYLHGFVRKVPPGNPDYGRYYRERAQEAIRKIGASSSPLNADANLFGKLRRFLGGN